MLQWQWVLGAENARGFVMDSLSSHLLAFLTNSGHCFLRCPASYSFSPSTMKAGGQTHFPGPQRKSKQIGELQQFQAGYDLSSFIFSDLSSLPTHTKQTAWHHLHSAHKIYSKSKHPFPSSLTVQNLIPTRHRRDGLCVFSSSCSSINKLSFASLSIKPSLAFFYLNSLTDKLGRM